MADYARAVPPPERPHWPGTGRAAALFVGIPLTAALVLAAAPLSEPPAQPPAVSLLPAALVRPAAAAGPVLRALRPPLRRDCDAPARAAGRSRAQAPDVIVVTPRAAAPAPRNPSVPRIIPVMAPPMPRAVTGRTGPLAPPFIAAVVPGVERVVLQSP
ncbi:MAG TPA: hypothetical protein VGT02_14750 [Methylomirabilota bacterium]|jgi:hypothetical protein|nr:hypothetical protein [Methylomirabilota bacterium]